VRINSAVTTSAFLRYALLKLYQGIYIALENISDFLRSLTGVLAVGFVDGVNGGAMYDSWAGLLESILCDEIGVSIFAPIINP
jgi:hypothetical protein